MAKDRDYPDLLNALKGRKVSVWTCGTCARLCYGLGGKDSADRLADALRTDGIDVIDVGSASAGCMESKLVRAGPFGMGSDVIVSITCGIGARCAESVFKNDVLNPVITYGAGLVRIDGTPVLIDPANGTETVLSDLSERISPDAAPFV